MTGPQVPRSASCSSTQIAPALGRRWVWRATRRACQAGTSSRRTRFQQQREPVAQVQGVGDQLCPGRRGHAQGERERLGGERRHQRGAVTAQRLVGQQGRAAGGLDAGVGGGGVQDRPVVGQRSLRNAARRSASFGLDGGFEHAGGVEVADLVLLPDRGAHGTSQASTTDTRGRESPVSTGFRAS